MCGSTKNYWNAGFMKRSQTKTLPQTVGFSKRVKKSSIRQ